jgi:cation-transporting ATPase 13A1
VLLVFAVAAAGFVLQAGWHDERRSRAKLLLNCSMIVASVVPPELPMNLSLAVNASIASLARLGVFCTEPFRIPFAGKVGVCCFDKTGTLTSEELQLQGVAGVASPNAAGVSLLTPPDALPDETVQVLVGCHSLLYIDDELSGETMERAAMQRLDWGLSKGDVSSEKGGRRRRIEVVHRFPFASSLGRMATLVEMSEGGGRAAGARALLALAKGAPEVMMQRFTDVPPFYEKTFKHFARQGARVLALGWKRLDPQPLSKATPPSPPRLGGVLQIAKRKARGE